MICMFKVIHYWQLIYLKTLEICVLKYTNLILQNVFQLQDQYGKQLYNKAKVKLDLLTDINMLLIVEKGIR